MKKFPKIMGIVNVTPDSFSDGGKYIQTEAAVSHCLSLMDSGADILDIGGESTRPGADPVSADEELSRTLPVINSILEKRPDAIISIDTTKYEVALEAAKAGAQIINDVSGLDIEPGLANIAAEKKISLVLMHMQGLPRNMQKDPKYENVVEDIYHILKKKIELARAMGANSIIADIGIGFGKTLEHNLVLLRNIERFNKLGVPILLGISRKSFIGAVLDIEKPDERDLPTAFIHAMLPGFGGDIIRVHNVAYYDTMRTLFNRIHGL